MVINLWLFVCVVGELKLGENGEKSTLFCGLCLMFKRAILSYLLASIIDALSGWLQVVFASLFGTVLCYR